MPDHGGMAVAAFEQTSVDDNAATETRAQGEQYEAVEGMSCAVRKFSERCGTSVVAESDRQVAIMAHSIAQRKVVPAGQIHRRDQSACRQVDRSRRGQADGCDIASF